MSRHSAKNRENVLKLQQSNNNNTTIFRQKQKHVSIIISHFYFTTWNGQNGQVITSLCRVWHAPKMASCCTLNFLQVFCSCNFTPRRITQQTNRIRQENNSDLEQQHRHAIIFDMYFSHTHSYLSICRCGSWRQCATALQLAKLINYEAKLFWIDKFKSKYLASLDKWLDALSGWSYSTLDNTRPFSKNLRLGTLGQWGVDVQLAKEGRGWIWIWTWAIWFVAASSVVTDLLALLGNIPFLEEAGLQWAFLSPYRHGWKLFQALLGWPLLPPTELKH